VDWKARIEACASEFDADRVTRALAYVEAENLLLAALALGPDVPQPKTAGETLRHDLRTHLDQQRGVIYEAPKRRKRKTLGDDNG
jgi:hypothetical protein